MPGSNEKEFNYTLRGGFQDQITAKAKKTFSGFQKVSTGAMDKFKIAAIAAFAATTLAISKMTSDVLQLGDRFDKLNASFGISVETLSKLEFVAGRSGSSVEVMAKSFKKLQENIFDAGEGVITAQRAFNALGIDVEKLKRLRPEDQFTHIAEILSKIPDQATKTAVAFDLFGKGAEGVLAAAADGSKGIKKMFDKAQDLGIVMSTKVSKGIATFNDLMFDLERVVRSAVEKGINPLTKFVNENRMGMEDLAKTVGSVVTFGFRALTNVVIIAANAFNTLAIGGLALFAVLSKINSLFAKVTDLIGLTSGASDRLSESANAAVLAAGELSDRIQPLISLFGEQEKAAAKAVETLDKQHDIMKELTEGTDKGAKATKAATKANKEFSDSTLEVIKNTTTAAKTFNKAVPKIKSPAASSFKGFQAGAAGFKGSFGGQPAKKSTRDQRIQDAVERTLQEDESARFDADFNQDLEKELRKIGFKGGSSRGGRFPATQGQSRGSGQDVERIIGNGGNTIIVQGDIIVSAESFPNLGEQARRISREQGRQSRRGNGGTLNVQDVPGPSVGGQDSFLGRRVQRPKFSF